LGCTRSAAGLTAGAYLRSWDEFDRHSIVPRPAEMPGVDHLGFKVASEADLNAFARRIETAGTKVERPASSRGSGGG
jgi:catechol 2,3-dioxygenase